LLLLFTLLFSGYVLLSSSRTISFLDLNPPLLSLHSFPTRRSSDLLHGGMNAKIPHNEDFLQFLVEVFVNFGKSVKDAVHTGDNRSEEHTSELQSRFDLVCRLLLEKKKEDEIIVYGNTDNVE